MHDNQQNKAIRENYSNLPIAFEYIFFWSKSSFFHAYLFQVPVESDWFCYCNFLQVPQIHGIQEEFRALLAREQSNKCDMQ